MAIRVGYFENTDSCYTEGPFVMVMAGSWRIEVGRAGTKCPILPDLSIRAFLQNKGLPDSPLFGDEDLCACVVDYLNAKVKDGTLSTHDGHPIWHV